MSYSQFSLADLKSRFQVSLKRAPTPLFATQPAVAPSPFLREALHRAERVLSRIPSEKARSESIIAPVLGELETTLSDKVAVFSGATLDVAPAEGLNGQLDYLVVADPLAVVPSAPVLIVVEAKADSLFSGHAQCTAGLIAAQRLNQARGQADKLLYGVVTTGLEWQFLRFSDCLAEIDPHIYTFSEIDRILGVLAHLAATEI